MKLTPFERGLIAHLVGDWLLQNDWMAVNKMKLRHPAAWIHGLIHFLLLTVALGWMAGLVLAILHLIIDSRVPLRWWQRVFGQTNEGLMGMNTAMWADQVMHMLTIAAWVAIAMN